MGIVRFIVFLVRLLLSVLCICVFLASVQRFSVVGGMTGSYLPLYCYLPVGVAMMYFCYRKIWNIGVPRQSLNAQASQSARTFVVSLQPVTQNSAAPNVGVETNLVDAETLSRCTADSEYASRILRKMLHNYGRGAESRAREIVKRLFAAGGYSTMVRVCERVGAMGGDSRLLEMMWDGIGEWRG